MGGLGTTRFALLSIATLVLVGLGFLIYPREVSDEAIEPRLSLTLVSDDGSSSLAIANNDSYPLSLRIKAPANAGYELDATVEEPFSLMPGTRLEAYKIRGNVSALSVSLPISSAVRGSLEVDERAVYALPCPCDIPCRASTRTNSMSHVGWDKHAIDFDFPEGTDVLAISEGRVVDVHELSRTNCREFTPECDRFINKIVVLAADGRLVEYLHLQYKGALVGVGDYVERRQLVGRSGDTGNSTGPHLHVAVVKVTADLKQITIPMLFSTSRGLTRVSEGEVYASPDCAAE